jgi:hypothetical protein
MPVLNMYCTGVEYIPPKMTNALTFTD